MSVTMSPRAAGLRRVLEDTRRRVDVATIARWVPLGLIGLAALTALWTRMVELNQSMWNDDGVLGRALRHSRSIRDLQRKAIRPERSPAVRVAHLGHRDAGGLVHPEQAG
jgi:hypothetical protein